ncbi:unnamed protein product [Phytomonas sp. EM1]|nr:unnamed protein product [Phytomonas sp. EM1]|eukprot:CCW62590.1 unnamed protein product [Phytomonas sp. isolate EM1]
MYYSASRLVYSLRGLSYFPLSHIHFESDVRCLYSHGKRRSTPSTCGVRCSAFEIALGIGARFLNGFKETVLSLVLKADVIL